MNPRSTDCEADALTTTPSANLNRLTQSGKINDEMREHDQIDSFCSARSNNFIQSSNPSNGTIFSLIKVEDARAGGSPHFSSMKN